MKRRGLKVDAPIEDIIASIIEIDKSAIEIREEFKKDIFLKRHEVQEEIQRLMEEIVESQKKNLESIKKQEIERANNDAATIKEETVKKSEGMYQRFLRLKSKFLEETFKEIIGDGTYNNSTNNV